MRKSQPNNSKDEDKLPEQMVLKQLIVQRRKIEKEQKNSAKIGLSLTWIICVTLIYLAFYRVPTDIAFVMGIGTLILAAVLIVQAHSLIREIRSIVPRVDEWTYMLDPSVRVGRIEEVDVKILSKVYDVNKNIIDKLFEKLKTFSNTWLVVSGGIASTLLIEIFKSEGFDVHSALILIICSVLVWDIAQNLYGILNYELLKKTKDLSYWWLAIIRSRDTARASENRAKPVE